MNYSQILKSIAEKENISVQDAEKEMQLALAYSGLDCSVKEFIKAASKLITEKTIYSR